MFSVNCLWYWSTKWGLSWWVHCKIWFADGSRTVFRLNWMFLEVQDEAISSYQHGYWEIQIRFKVWFILYSYINNINDILWIILFLLNGNIIDIYVIINFIRYDNLQIFDGPSVLMYPINATLEVNRDSISGSLPLDIMNSSSNEILVHLNVQNISEISSFEIHFTSGESINISLHMPNW